jgi:hypothetical protein
MAKTAGPLPRAYSTPECRTGGDRWPDLHGMCSAPGYQDRVLGWVTVPCACSCHEHADAAQESPS